MPEYVKCEHCGKKLDPHMEAKFFNRRPLCEEHRICPYCGHIGPDDDFIYADKFNIGEDICNKCYIEQGHDIDKGEY